MESYQSNIVNTQIPRLEKAFENLKHVEHVDEEIGIALVRSATNSKKFYEVAYLRDDCNCPDNQFRHITCWHLNAVKLFLEQRNK